MPLTIALLLACLTALKWLCHAAGALMAALLVRMYLDPEPQMPLERWAVASGIFFLTGFSIGLMRKAIARRSGLD